MDSSISIREKLQDIVDIYIDKVWNVVKDDPDSIGARDLLSIMGNADKFLEIMRDKSYQDDTEYVVNIGGDVMYEKKQENDKS